MCNWPEQKYRVLDIYLFSLKIDYLKIVSSTKMSVLRKIEANLSVLRRKWNFFSNIWSGWVTLYLQGGVYLTQLWKSPPVLFIMILWWVNQTSQKNPNSHPSKGAIIHNYQKTLSTVKWPSNQLTTAAASSTIFLI